MTDFGTMYARMLVDSHKPNATSQCKAAIVDALKHFKGVRTAFSQKYSTISLTSGTREYSLPTDFISADDVRWSNSGQTQLWPLERVSIDEIRSLRALTATAGRPSYWALHHNKIILFPTPGTTGDLVDIWYQFDTTLDTATGNPITTSSGSTVTNNWFTDGYVALLNRSLYHLFKGWIHDPEKAQDFLEMSVLAEGDIVKLGARWHKPGRIKGYW